MSKTDKSLNFMSGIINMVLGVGVLYAAVFAHSPKVTLPFIIAGGVIGGCMFLYGLAKSMTATTS